MFTFNNKAIHYNGLYPSGFRVYYPPNPVYYVSLSQNEGGTVSAYPLSGHNGESVTLSYTANENYEFDEYSITGSTLHDYNKFRFQGSDVTAEALFNYVPPPARNLTLLQQLGGTITADKTTGFDNDVVTLSNTADNNYTFDSYSLTGSTIYDVNKFKFNGSDVTAKANFIVNLPSKTIRVKFKSNYTPPTSMGNRQTLVDSTNNIWDIYKSSNDWSTLFRNNYSLLEVLGANTSGVTNMNSMFYSCDSLTYVPLFDTSNVTNMYSMFYLCNSLSSIPLFNTSNVSSMGRMFYACHALTSIPLFNTSKVTDMYSTFQYCSHVEQGALALYQQASTQTNPPSDHRYTFNSCGTATQTGSAELAQIPSDWGGTMS